MTRYHHDNRCDSNSNCTVLARKRDKQRGFILPAVLFTMLVVALLASSVQAAVWQSSRHARLAFAGERALHGADAAIAQRVAAWDARAFASMPIGQRTATNLVLTPGLTATVTLVRTAPDAAIIEATAASSNNGTSLDAHRRVTRALTVRTPSLPLAQPLTSLGAITLATPANVSTTDEVPPGWTTECQGITPVDAPNMPIANVTIALSQFDDSWNKWRALASRSDDAFAVTPLAPIVTGGVCAPGAGDPLRGAPSTAPCINEWGARLLTNSSGVPLSGPNRHQGVMLVDGDLAIDGTLEIDGLLIVRGALDASRGTLTVYGATLVRDEMGHGSRLGIASRVRYSRCALRRALSAVGAPAAITSRGWLERF